MAAKPCLCLCLGVKCHLMDFELRYCPLMNAHHSLIFIYNNNLEKLVIITVFSLF